MNYYHDLVTQKSWQELRRLKKKLDFVLIGGWAVYLYTKQLKSKDIDIVVSFDKLARLEEDYQLSKNERLAKYEARKGEVEIDVYLPHYSKLGIGVEKLLEKTRQLEGFKVLESEYLLALKLYTLQQRERSVKGKKDLIDIISLCQAGVVEDSKVKRVVKDHQLEQSVKVFKKRLGEYFEIPELGLNKYQLAKVKKELKNKSWWKLG